MAQTKTKINTIYNNYLTFGASRELLFNKQHNDKLNNLQRLFLNNNLHKKDYYETFIKNKNTLEKRKFLSLLLLVSTNLSLKELINLKVEDFLNIIDNINNNLNNYVELENYNLEDNFTDDKYYITIRSKDFNLKLNIAFNEFFKEELYNNFISTKNNEEPVLTSIINNKPLAATNFFNRKDLNKEIVELI
uniref:hypothetical protein n=1 Tax=Ulva meridionalis TaxID=434723 RepID=UPI0028E0A32D|nr:hypothetical protein NQY40_pgp087 [Ulva meridionalis]WFS80024.1 hypothetical protein [Ulva meridionalis]